jgi:hypothetical protein
MENTEHFFDAVGRGDVAATRELLARDRTLAGARDSTGATPLHVAALNGRREIVEVLLEAGADINARDATFDATPAGWAIEPLRERGALLAIEIEDLLFAIERGDVTWASRLLARHPALKRAVDRDGTPLSTHAAASAEPAMARLFADGVGPSRA